VSLIGFHDVSKYPICIHALRLIGLKRFFAGSWQDMNLLWRNFADNLRRVCCSDELAFRKSLCKPTDYCSLPLWMQMQIKLVNQIDCCSFLCRVFEMLICF